MKLSARLRSPWKMLGAIPFSPPLEGVFPVPVVVAFTDIVGGLLGGSRGSVPWRDTTVLMEATTASIDGVVVVIAGVFGS